MASCVLIVEDEPTLTHVLEATLEYGGFEARVARTGQEAIEAFDAGGIDAVLLDLGLPDLSGRELLMRLRQRSDMPILVVSGHDTESDRVQALDLGADDFVPKPFLPGELLARIRAALRRVTRPEPTNDMQGIEVDPVQPIAIVRGQAIYLTSNEHKLLTVLADRPDRAVDADEIIAKIWEEGDTEQHGHLRVLIHKVREKIELDPKSPKYLMTVYGIGYRLRGVEKIVAQVAA